MMWPSTEQFVKFRELPVVGLTKCVMPECETVFLSQKNRVVCWSHYEWLFSRRGSVPKVEITDDVTQPLPGLR